MASNETVRVEKSLLNNVQIPVAMNCKWCSFETAFSTSTASFEAIAIRVKYSIFLYLKMIFDCIGSFHMSRPQIFQYITIKTVYGCCELAPHSSARKGRRSKMSYLAIAYNAFYETYSSMGTGQRCWREVGKHATDGCHHRWCACLHSHCTSRSLDQEMLFPSCTAGLPLPSYYLGPYSWASKLIRPHDGAGLSDQRLIIWRLFMKHKAFFFFLAVYFLFLFFYNFPVPRSKLFRSTACLKGGFVFQIVLPFVTQLSKGTARPEGT